MTKSRNILPPRKPWTEAHLQMLVANYAHSPAKDLAQTLGRSVDQVYRKAFALGLKKEPEVIARLAREAMLDPNHPGRRHQFQPGQAPVNKGKKMPPGWKPGRMGETQFTKGQRGSNWVPIGTVRLNLSYGHLERKISDVPGSPHLRWRTVARLVWEEAHGPVPAGHMVVFKPGRHTIVLEEITLDAIEMISRSENARRNVPSARLPKDVAQLVQLKGAITRQINRRIKAGNPPPPTTTGEPA